MKPRILLMIAALTMVGVVLALKRNSPASPTPPPAQTPAKVAPATSAIASPAAAVPVTAKPVVAADGNDVPALIPAPVGQPAGKPAKKSPAPPKNPIQDPEARVALSFVGEDPDAEAYWISAINDPGLSAQERQDLIEDLNEDGLADPHQARPQDLPLILARIRLIEELAPYAMDQVNADAFAEAHKDLVNLALGGQAQ